MECIQKIARLRPYHLNTQNSILNDLEEQYQNHAVNTRVADLIAFAEGCESYMASKYGEKAALQITESPEHWLGVQEFKRRMVVLWECLDISTRVNLKRESMERVMDDMCNKTLPIGGTFVFMQ